jgi:hypothetical protein
MEDGEMSQLVEDVQEMISKLVPILDSKDFRVGEEAMKIMLIKNSIARGYSVKSFLNKMKLLADYWYSMENCRKNKFGS